MGDFKTIKESGHAGRYKGEVFAQGKGKGQIRFNYNTAVRSKRIKIVATSNVSLAQK